MIDVPQSGDRNPDNGSCPFSRERIDILLKVVNRLDFYINSTNAKASLIIAWNSFAFGAILLKYDAILYLFPYDGWPHYVSIFLLSLSGICSIISNVFAFSVTFPFLKPGYGKKNTPSMFFFGSICKKSVPEYSAMLTGATFETILSDLCEQTITLAGGLNTKMIKLQNSIRTIYLGLFAAGGLLVLKAIVLFFLS